MNPFKIGVTNKFSWQIDGEPVADFTQGGAGEGVQNHYRW